MNDVGQAQGGRKPILGQISRSEFRGSFWKEKPERDEKYLAWIRTLPCLECMCPAEVNGEKMIDAHHIETGGTATKCSDYLTVPLCRATARGCHAKADKSKESARLYRDAAERLHKLWSIITA